jgi:hypothetical protein
MITKTIGGRKVTYYDSIDQAPEIRHMLYSKFLLIDANVGSDLNSFYDKIMRAKKFVTNNEKNNALIEMDNLMQLLNLIHSGISVKNMAFAALIESIDGKKMDDLSDDGLKRVVELINTEKHNILDRIIEDVKKKSIQILNHFFQNIHKEHLRKIQSISLN